MIPAPEYRTQLPTRSWSTDRGAWSFHAASHSARLRSSRSHEPLPTHNTRHPLNTHHAPSTLALTCFARFHQEARFAGTRATPWSDCITESDTPFAIITPILRYPCALIAVPHGHSTTTPLIVSVNNGPFAIDSVSPTSDPGHPSLARPTTTASGTPCNRNSTPQTLRPPARHSGHCEHPPS